MANWTTKEVELLKELIEAGYKYTDIIEELPRHSYNSIYKKANDLGLKPTKSKQRIVEAYKKYPQLSSYKLGALLGVPPTTVRNTLHRLGYRTRYKRELLKEYLDSKPEAFWGTQEFIAKKFDCCVNTVSKAIKNWRCEHAKMDE